MSQLDALMSAAAEEEASPSEPVAGAETAEPSAPPDGAEVEVAAPDSEEKKPAEPAPPTDKVAARFAALAREKQRNLAQQQQIEQHARHLSQRAEQIAAREAELSSKLADAEKVLADPERLFAHLERTLGIRTIEDLQKHARAAWEKPKPKEDEDPAKKPLTRAELEQFHQAREMESRQRAAADTFVRMTDDDEKYEAAAVIFSAEERVRHGDRIANALTARGVQFTLEDIADAVDELARQDARYAKLQKRAQAKSAPPSAKPAPAGAAKATDTNGRQSSQARTLNNDVAAERANGAAPRLSHRERLQRLLSS